MHNKPLEQRKLQDILADIAAAKAYAQEQKVPLTAERLAAQMNMDPELFCRIARGTYPVGGKQTQEKVSAVQQAYGEATASVMEHALLRGSGSAMHQLYLKNNAGYGEPPEGDGDQPPVVFLGEADIPD